MGFGFRVKTTTGWFQYHTEPADVFHLDSHPDKVNVETIALLCDGWTSLLADSPLNVGRRSTKPARVFASFRKSFLGGTLRGIISMYSGLADKLMNSPSLFGSTPETGAFIPEFRDTPVFREYHNWFETGDPELYSYVLNFCLFAKKLRFEDETLNSTALRGWEEVEEKLSKIELPSAICADLSYIVADLVRGFELKQLALRFGPGAVSEQSVRGWIQKANRLKFSPRIDYLFFRGLNVMRDPTGEKGFRDYLAIPNDWEWNPASGVSIEESKQLFVPRDVHKSRTICEEPNTYMAFQQAVARSLHWTMRRSSIKHFVDIEDQSRNRLLAQYGSATGMIDTIDLSAASDSVHVDLVKKIFPRSLLKYMLATRTSLVRKVDGTVVQVKKFAPMGSALCFPTQCIVFTAVVIYAAMLHADGIVAGGVLSDKTTLSSVGDFVTKRFRKSPGWSRRKSYEPAAVFGDDICVDTLLTQHVTTLLDQLGFSVNHGKSFVGNVGTRESCGGYYVNGHDVTPIRFRAYVRGNTLDARQVMTMIAGANNAGFKGLHHYRRFLIHTLRTTRWASNMPSNVVFTRDPDENGRVFTRETGPINLSARTREAKPPCTHDTSKRCRRCSTATLYQREEMMVYQADSDSKTQPKPRETWAADRYRMTRWWDDVSGIPGIGFDRQVTHNVVKGVKLHRRWIPVER